MSTATTTKQEDDSPARIIGRWTIGDTLGKGGYSWVKRGQDIKTGKIVALKFMEKADVSWVKEQAKQVETEIEALKNIRHQNVMKLYAYNLNAQYPVNKTDNKNTDNKFIDTILLVLEYAPGGELFDILYYTSALKEEVARTYFKQIVSGLEACHNNGVVHRDLKPQNLLLDAKYNIKITDFGLSKIIESDADAIMKTTYVGTRGYQAPELLANLKYDLKCDIFSIGVILFILLAGYPPFEQANKTDKWFKPLIQKKIEKFWKAHSKSPIASNPEAKDLLTQMLTNDPKERIDIASIKTHDWMKGATLKPKELITELRDRHRKAEKKRRMDVRKMNDLAQSINKNKPIPGLKENVKIELFPENQVEGILCDIYTFGNKWYDIYTLIEEAITGEMYKGVAVFDFEKNMLKCTLRTMVNNAEKTVVFDVKVYESRFWNNRYKEEDDAEEIKERNEDQIYIVRITRCEGDPLTYRNIKNNVIFVYCSTILKGLPNWAQKVQEKLSESISKAKKNEDDEKEAANDNDYGLDDDDYDKLIGEYEWKSNKKNLKQEKYEKEPQKKEVAAK